MADELKPIEVIIKTDESVKNAEALATALGNTSTAMDKAAASTTNTAAAMDTSTIAARQMEDEWVKLMGGITDEERKFVAAVAKSNQATQEKIAVSSLLGVSAAEVAKAQKALTDETNRLAKEQAGEAKAAAKALAAEMKALAKTQEEEAKKAARELAEETKRLAKIQRDEAAAAAKKLREEQKKADGAFGESKKSLKEYAEMAEHATGVNTGLAGVIRGAGNPAFLAAGIAALAVGKALEVWKEQQELVKESIETSVKWVEAYTKSLTDNKSAQESFSDFQERVINSGRALADVKMDEAITAQGEAIKKTAKEAEIAAEQYKYLEHTGGLLSASAEFNQEALDRAAAAMKRTGAEAEAAKLYLEELTKAQEAGFRTVNEYEASLRHWNDIAQKAYDITNKITPATRTLREEQKRLADEFNRGAMSLDEFVQRAAQLQTIYSASAAASHRKNADSYAAAQERKRAALEKRHAAEMAMIRSHADRSEGVLKESAGKEMKIIDSVEKYKRGKDKADVTAFKKAQDDKLKYEQQSAQMRIKLKEQTENAILGILDKSNSKQARMISTAFRVFKVIENLKTQMTAIQEANRLASQASAAASGMQIKGGMAVAEIGTNTASAATGSFSAMASIPYIGPILGAAAALAAMIYGQQKAGEAKDAAASFQGQADKGMIAPEDGSYLMNLRKGEHLIPDEMLGDVASSLRGAAMGGGGMQQEKMERPRAESDGMRQVLDAVRGSQAAQQGGGQQIVQHHYHGTVIDAQDANRRIAHANQQGKKQFGIGARR